MKSIDNQSMEGNSKSPNETLASVVYSELLSDILMGKLKPGHKLRLQTLKSEYNVGNSPLREALNRLTSNGMVLREENKGFRVSTASVEELEELIKTRCWLEEKALRESIKNGGEEYQERLVIAMHRLSRAEDNQELNGDDSYFYSPEAEDRHQEYHQALIAACGSKILLQFCQQLQEQTLRYRNLVEVVKYREGNEGKEHQAIVDAVLAEDADEATALLVKHYQVTAEILIESGSLEHKEN